MNYAPPLPCEPATGTVGVETILNRFSTILDENPGDLYYDSRGNQVLQAFVELLPEYPFGAANVFSKNGDGIARLFKVLIDVYWKYPLGPL